MYAYRLWWMQWIPAAWCVSLSASIWTLAPSLSRSCTISHSTCDFQRVGMPQARHESGNDAQQFVANIKHASSKLHVLCAGAAGNIHGLACWFDVAFEGSSDTRHLSTAPGLPVTHWYADQCSNSWQAQNGSQQSTCLFELTSDPTSIDLSAHSYLDDQ